jgi:hypothetical protein
MRPVSLVGGPLAVHVVRGMRRRGRPRVRATELRTSAARRPSAVVDGGVAWWAETPTEVAKQLDVDPESGLSTAEVCTVGLCPPFQSSHMAPTRQPPSLTLPRSSALADSSLSAPPTQGPFG